MTSFCLVEQAPHEQHANKRTALINQWQQKIRAPFFVPLMLRLSADAMCGSAGLNCHDESIALKTA